MKSIVLLMAAALCGCAAVPTRITTNAPAVRLIPALKVEVNNFAIAKQVRESDSVYFSGWFPIADRWVDPTFHEAITAKIRDSLRPSGHGEVVQLGIIESGLFMDMKASDSVPFFGLAATVRERPYKCNLVININTNRGSERREFEHVQFAHRAFGDLEDKPGFVSKCQDALVLKLADYLN